MRALIWLIGFLALPALGASGVTIQNVRAFTNAGAGANHSSADPADAAAYKAPIDTGLFASAALQCRWSGLTGTIDSSIKLQASNDGTTWSDKSGAVFDMTGSSAAGSILMSVTNVTELSYQVVYAHGSVTGGTLNCQFVAKP